MSIFSRLFKNLKKGLRKIAPLAAPFIPGIGGVLAGLVTQRAPAARTPGIIADIGRPPLPGAGAVPTRAARFPRRRDPSQALRKRVITPGPVRQQMSIFAALPAVARAAPSIIRTGAQAVGRFIGSPAGRATIGGTAALELARTFGGDGAAGGACPSGWHLNKEDGVGGAAGTYCVRNRRTNFGNARAARRSVRRLKGARKLLRDIEKMMPTRTVRARHGPASPPHAPR